MSAHVNAVIPIEGLADPMPMKFPLKIANFSGAGQYIGIQLVAPPVGWANYSEMQCGLLGAESDDYFIYDTPTRTKPTTGTSETVTLRITRYSDEYVTEISHHDVEYTFTYIDFDSGTYDVVDTDTFEDDLEGWTGYDDVGATSLARSTTLSRTGIASMCNSGFGANEVGSAAKKFTIGAVSKAYFRLWMQADIASTAKYVIDLNNLPIPLAGTPKGGSEICQQWICIACELPVNGTYGVRLKARCEAAGGNNAIYYDDLKVITKA